MAGQSVFGSLAALVVAGSLLTAGNPAFGQTDDPRMVTAPSTPLMNKDCQKAFRKDLKALHAQGAQNWEDHKAHFLSESAIYDGMRVLLADPNTPPEGIAQQQSAATQFLNTTLPIVAKDRKKAFKTVKKLEARFLDPDSGCLRREGRRVFTEGTAYWRSALTSVYTAHDHLFDMNRAVAALRMDDAFKWMQADVLAMSTVEQDVDNADAKFDMLLGR